VRGDAEIEGGRTLPAIACILHTRVCRKKLTGPKTRQAGPRRRRGPPHIYHGEMKSRIQMPVPQTGRSSGLVASAAQQPSTGLGKRERRVGPARTGKEDGRQRPVRGPQARPGRLGGRREGRSKTGADKKRTAPRRKARGGSHISPDGYSKY
jgi:hypothetical protein